MRLFCLLSVVSLVCVAAPLRAQSGPTAEEQQSLEHYQKGVTSYDLGKFDDAVQEFQKAYEIKPTPAYLYNIAQAHRQKGDVQKALFFYRRYLQKAPQAANRDTVERRIAELEEQAKKQDEAKPRPAAPRKPEHAEKPEARRPPPPVAMASPAPPTQGAPAAADVQRAAPPPSNASRVRLAIAAGPTFVSLGDGPDVPVQISLAAGVAFTLHFGDVALDLGVLGGLTPLPFETLERTASGTALLVGLLGNLTLRFAPSPRVDLRLEAGGGAALMTGLAARNPFTDRGAESDTLFMPAARLALGLDYALGRSFRLTLTPAFAWAKASKKLADRISAIIRLDVLLGVAVTL